ncbi:MAG TPA: Xaa-Pro aminopeptidase, partial [Bacteroidales bacterium]|nr:Xaa-Pro aminopeptidase [Bacteroidales bacterium]
MFRKETYIQRRNELKTKVQKGIILFFGNSESSMNYADNTYHFRQDSTFLYYTGLSQPDLALTIDLETGEEVLYGDNFGIDSIVWMGTQPSIAERAALAGISKTNAFSELSQTFLMAKKQNRTIHFIPPYRGETRIQLFELLGIHPSEIGKNASVELIKAVASQRNYKTNEEIAEIEKAANLTTDMHVAGMRLLKPGMNEAQIAAEVTKIALAANGNLSFPVIATINGQTLHNHFHGNIAQSGQLFLLDCGAETEMGYAGDMSSTFPVGAKFTSEQRVIYEIALASHQKAVSMLKPGI